MTKVVKIHYAGELRYTKTDGTTTEIFGGWAACCFGPRAEKIKLAGTHTYDSAKVTCGTCQKLMMLGGALRPEDVGKGAFSPGQARPSHKKGEAVTAHDEAAKAMGLDPWLDQSKSEEIK